MVITRRVPLPGTPRVYSAGELKTDLAIHVIGISAAVVAVITLLEIAMSNHGNAHLAAISIYAAGLLAMLGFSAIHNHARLPRFQEAIRRCDQGAIYLMIAGTYTPFVANIADPAWRCGLMTTVWLTALTGLAIKLACPRLLNRGSVLAYLGLGWIAFIAVQPFLDGLAASTILLLAVGGFLYTFGVVFHLWERLQFHNAIWHAVVVAAAGCHYCAVLFGIALAAAS